MITVVRALAAAVVIGLSLPSLAHAGNLDAAFAPAASAITLATDQTPQWADFQERLDEPVVVHAAQRSCKADRAAPSKAPRQKAAALAKTTIVKPTPCPVAAPSDAAPFDHLAGASEMDRIRGVDRVVNALPYVSDRQNWGLADYWETPREMFARGGDCEGFALTKYLALRALGVPDDAMRVAVVWDRRDREEHAVLLVRSGGQTWVLDNKTEAPTRLVDDPNRYRPIYSLNDAGVRMAPRAVSSRGVQTARLADGGRTLVLNIRPRAPVANIMPAGD